MDVILEDKSKEKYDITRVTRRVLNTSKKKVNGDLGSMHAAF